MESLPGEQVLIVLSPEDDVAVVRTDLKRGHSLVIGGAGVTVRDDIPVGHKIALRRVPRSGWVRKYGQVIGAARDDISTGDWVHTHNLVAGRFERTLESPVATAASRPTLTVPTTFDGYVRPDGSVGTRNVVAVIATVNCAADAACAIASELRNTHLPLHPNVDGVIAITHQGGCGIAVDGPSHRILQRCLGGIATNPNIAATLYVGLGCEVNQADALVRWSGRSRPAWRPPAAVVDIQRIGGVGPAVRLGVQSGETALRSADSYTRRPAPIAKLVVGTNCGGSDAHSGVSANPAVGLVGDALIDMGASWVLAETPETYGAEHLLGSRAATKDVARRLNELMRWWESYTAAHGAEIDNNPAPGNKEGGLSTIYEKALGAVTKGGSRTLMDVIGYAEHVRMPGLTFMDTPGLDNVSVTGLAAGGCNTVVFTTGRGSCLAFDGVPVVKVAATTGLYNRMIGDMDVNAGIVLDGAELGVAAQQLVSEIVAVASGRRTKGETQGLGTRTFSPWDLGPTL